MEKILKSNNLSDFEKKVYLAVSKIPKGEVRSYKWVAAKIGHPKAYRAVGNALNKNPYIRKMGQSHSMRDRRGGTIPIFTEVPCHRVIRSDGSIGGFAKGVARKKEMLKAETSPGSRDQAGTVKADN